MKNKIEITEKQLNDFKRMHSALKLISKEYQTSDEIRRNCEKQYGLDYDEALEMAYDNIKQVASNAVHGVKIPKVD